MTEELPYNSCVVFRKTNRNLQKLLLGIVRVPENSRFAEIKYLLFIREN